MISPGKLLKQTFSEFLNDKVPRLGAALAYYTTFSIAPLLVIAIALAGALFGKEAVAGHLKHELTNLLGRDGAEGLQAMIAAAGKERHAGPISSVLGVIALIFGATGVFLELKDSMNTNWKVRAPERNFLWSAIRDRLLSFAMVLSIAFLLLVSLILSALLAAFGQWLPVPESWATFTDFIVSTAVITFLLMLIFKYLPDADVAWREVWLGALVTAILFAVGKYLIGLYLGSAGISSAYGAAGSLAVLLLWTYYSSQILFLGAELTKVYARLTGDRMIAAKPISGGRDDGRLGETQAHSA